MSTSKIVERLREKLVDHNVPQINPDKSKDIIEMAGMLQSIPVVSPDFTIRCSFSDREFKWSPEEMKRQTIYDPLLKREVEAVLHPDYEALRTEAVPIVCMSCYKVHAWRKPGNLHGYAMVAAVPLHTPVCPTCLSEAIAGSPEGSELGFPILELKAAECDEKGVDFKDEMSKWKAKLENYKQASQLNPTKDTHGQEDRYQEAYQG